MNDRNKEPLCILDDGYQMGFDRTSKWGHLKIVAGPRLNFFPTSVQRLRDFLNAPSPRTPREISSMYSALEDEEGALTLLAGNNVYSLSSGATHRLKDFLNEVLPEK